MRGSHKYSILQGTEKCCFITGRTDNLHMHHIYGAANRKISDKNGFWIWLTGELHNQNSRIDIHHNKEFDLRIKRICQSRYEEHHYRYEFLKLIGRNYLD